MTGDSRGPPSRGCAEPVRRSDDVSDGHTSMLTRGGPFKLINSSATSSTPIHSSSSSPFSIISSSPDSFPLADGNILSPSPVERRLFFDDPEADVDPEVDAFFLVKASYGRCTPYCTSYSKAISLTDPGLGG